MFLAPVCTTSSKLFTVSLMLSSLERSSRWFFSKNSRTVFEERPIAFAYILTLNKRYSTPELNAPSMHYKCHLVPSGRDGVSYHEDQIQRWVLRFQMVSHRQTGYIAGRIMGLEYYRRSNKILTCWIPAICLVMYSTVTGSSTVRRWLWHSIRALSINTRPSAVNPSMDICQTYMLSVGKTCMHTSKG